MRLITQAQLLANAADIDGPGLTATSLAIATGGGTLVDNGNGTWNYTPTSNDDTAVSFNYTVTDGSLSAAGTATLDITPVNDAPTTSVATLAAIAEDSGVRLITQAQLLANAADIDGPGLTAISLAIASGSGTLVDNGNGTWNYTPASNDDTAISFSYTVTDGSLTAAGTATLDITPVNDAPTTSTVTLAAIAEDSGVRLITQAQLLANAADIDGPSLTATTLAIATGSGTLLNNGNGTWNYTPASDDDSSVSFNYTVTDGSLAAAGTATLDLTPINDAPTVTGGATVALAASTENTASAPAAVGAILAGAAWADVDTGAASGIAVVAASGGGAWQYSTDALTWNGVGAVSSTNALLLASTSQVRYVAGSGATSAGMTFVAWDQSSGSASTNSTPVYATASAGGGGSAYSLAQANVSLAVTVAPLTPVVPVVVSPPGALPADPVVTPQPTPPASPSATPPAATAPSPASAAAPAAPSTPASAPAGSPLAEAAIALEQAITQGVLTQTLSSISLPQLKLVANEAPRSLVAGAPLINEWDFASLDFRWDALLRAPAASASTSWAPPGAVLSADLDAASEDATQANDKRRLLSFENGVKFGSTAATAGLVAWALRGAGLASSLLISMPAWRHLDPIPVLSADEAKPDWERDSDDEKRRAEDDASGEAAVADLLRRESA